MIRTINENWLQELKNELTNTNEVCIVSPFITDNIVKHLLDNFKGKTIKIITRYNLNDFKRGVSSLTAIDRLVKNNAQVKGIIGLHSKVYLFDKKSVIITSANFTNGGFFNNKEFGVLSYASNTITQSKRYFNDLWKIDHSLLDTNKINEWKEKIAMSKPLPKTSEELPDYGVSYQKSIIKKRRYFVKFFGTSDHRASLEKDVLEELKGGCGHFALSFSKNKKDSRPVRYRDDDIVFLARMTDTFDYAIFGRAETIAHDRVRDIASVEDINHINWLKDWPILVRVKNPVFINSTLENCPKLNDLIDDLDYDSFSKTKERYNNGERNIFPKKSLMRKGDVKLSNTGAQWLELKFRKALNKEGQINSSIINSFYQGKKIII